MTALYLASEISKEAFTKSIQYLVQLTDTNLTDTSPILKKMTYVTLFHLKKLILSMLLNFEKSALILHFLYPFYGRFFPGADKVLITNLLPGS